MTRLYPNYKRSIYRTHSQIDVPYNKQETNETNNELESINEQQDIPIGQLDYMYRMLHYNIEYYDDYNWYDSDDISKMTDDEFMNYHNSKHYIYSHEYDHMIQDEDMDEMFT